MKVKSKEYYALHRWVEARLGKPRFCLHCKSTTAPIYDWSNISGKYLRDVSDWRRLCRNCHLIADGHKDKPKCVRGHRMTPENTYTSPKGYKECRACRREAHSISNRASNMRYRQRMRHYIEKMAA